MDGLFCFYSVKHRWHNAPPVLEHYPLEQLWLKFIHEVKMLKAERDTVGGKKREYVSTSAITGVYEEIFGNGALSKSTIIYRQKQLHVEEFENDFLVLNDMHMGNQWMAKYYVNRLNTQLLKKIYMPQPGEQLIRLAKITNMIEQNLRDLEELDEWKDE